MRVLTVRPPWSHAIAHLGKDVENRSRRPGYEGPVAIHAGRTREVAAETVVEELAGRRLPERVPAGYVVAIVDLVGAHSADDCWQDDGSGRSGHCSPWAQSGAFHWELSNVRPLADPFPMVGALGLRWLPADFEAEIVRRLA